MQKVNNNLIVKNLFFTYDKNKKILDSNISNVNYEFEPNNVYAIIGKSGSGKSTFINSLNLINKPISGSLILDDLIYKTKIDLNNINVEIIKVNINSIIISVDKEVNEKFLSLYINSKINNKLISIKKTKINQSKNKNSYEIFFNLNCINDLNIINNLSTNSLFSKKNEIKNLNELRKKISIVFQFPEEQLFKDTVEKDVIFGPLNFKIDKNIALKNAHSLLEKLHIKSNQFNESWIHLSGGEKRKVAIAGILIIDSKVVIFDEPTVGLDYQTKLTIFDIINDLKKQNKTIIIVSHDMNSILDIADKIILFDNNKIVFDAEPYAFFREKEILEKNNIKLPNVINFVSKLIDKNPEYNFLWEKKPKNIDELAKLINDFRRE